MEEVIRIQYKDLNNILTFKKKIIIYVMNVQVKIIFKVKS